MCPCIGVCIIIVEFQNLTLDYILMGVTPDCILDPAYLGSTIVSEDKRYKSVNEKETESIIDI